jgi:putative ABC transport system ATP-binding protein
MLALVLEARSLSKVYASPAGDVTALIELSHAFEPGRVTAVMGPSGSGKSTLLNLLAGFDRPSSGDVLVGGRPIGELSERERSGLRLHSFGFVFQSSNLVTVLSALQNVAFPMALAGGEIRGRERRARSLLERFGVDHRAKAHPTRLSGGERQRVALARALANDPDIIFADEPTGSLDSESGREVLAALRDVASDGRTVVVVTHDPTLGDHADVVLRMHDGRLIGTDTATPDPAAPPRPAPLVGR